MTASPPRPTQWTVGQLRAELVALPDDTRLVIDVPVPAGGTRRYPITGAGYGPNTDPTDPIFAAQEYPLTADTRPQLDGVVTPQT